MPNDLPSLTRRERQIMDILYRLGKATAAEVLNQLPDQPNYSTVRAQMRVLEEKGHVTHEEEGTRYVYRPTLARGRARRSALRHLVDTFFDGSAEQVVAALVGGDVARLEPQELERLSRLIAEASAKQKGKASQ